MQDRYREFGAALDAIKKRELAKVGAEDVRYITQLNRFSRAMEVAGRALIHFSPEPASFSLGVFALFVHKQLQAAEVGHSALHGCYDKFPEAERFHSKRFRWDAPIEEEGWRLGHNVKHHGNTNIAGKDPDIHFGLARLTPHVPHKFQHWLQLPFMLFVLAPNFAMLMNMHFTGLYDAYFDNGMPQPDVLPDRSRASVRHAWKRALGKWAPYYAKNYVFFPALAGPMFWKVLLGNWLAETTRDLYTAATIFCGHAGAEVQSYPLGTTSKSKGHWYAMQVESSNNYEVPWVLSVLCGGLDRQIEHHLFPTLPPQRIRAIAPEVRALCEEHGVQYKTGSWPRVLGRALAHVARLSRRAGAWAVLREAA